MLPMNTINEETPKVTECFISNKLHINTNKTVAILFHRREKTLTINESLININGDTIPFSTDSKSLGIKSDNNLTWKTHINYIITKISKGVGILLHLRKNVLTIIYKTLILPYFTHCCSTWGFTYHTCIDKILNIQKTYKNPSNIQKEELLTPQLALINHHSSNNYNS